MLTTEQRERLIAETKSWLGTPYRGWSRSKGNGVDCGQLLIGVYCNLGFIPDMMIPYYSLQIAQHRHDTAYLLKVEEYCREISEREVLPGDLVIYKLGLAFAHGGIIVEWPRHVIHALGGHGVTGTHGNRAPMFRKSHKKFYTLKDEFCTEKKWV